MRNKIIALVAVSAMWSGVAHATSVSQNQAAANNMVTSATTGSSAGATAGIIASGVSGAISGGVAPPSFNIGASPVTYFNSRAMTGVAGGGADKKAGVWVQGGYSTIDNSDAGGEFDGNIQNLVAGIDFKPNDNSVLGLSLAYEDVDVTTKFNTGTFKGKGYTLAPYGGLVLGNGAVIDGMIGVSKLKYKTSRTNRTITGSFDGTRYMANINVSKGFSAKNFIITPKVGVLQVREKQDAFTESNGTAAASNTINLGRASGGATIALNGEKFSPYVRAMAEYDYKKGAAADLGNGRVASNDKFGVNTALGMNAKINDKLSFNVEATSSANFRNNLDIYGITGRLRYDY